MLADEITADLRRIRADAIGDAARTGTTVARRLASKGIDYGVIRAFPTGTVDTSDVQGVDADLRVRPFFQHGGTISIREFVVGALKAEMGLAMAQDPDLVAAQAGRVTTPAGMVLDGVTDKIEQTPAEEGDIGSINERTALVDFLEFYLLNYFKPATAEDTQSVRVGRQMFERSGCASCHMPNLRIQRDRRVADVTTVFDPAKGNINRLFATARLLLSNPESIGQASAAKIPAYQPFTVENIYTDFAARSVPHLQHNYDGTVDRVPDDPAGALAASPRTRRPQHQLDRGRPPPRRRRRIAGRVCGARANRDAVIAFELAHQFPPDDTASNFDPGDQPPRLPAYRHGGIRLTVLFNNPRGSNEQDWRSGRLGRKEAASAPSLAPQHDLRGSLGGRRAGRQQRSTRWRGAGEPSWRRRIERAQP